MAGRDVGRHRADALVHHQVEDNVDFSEVGVASHVEVSAAQTDVSLIFLRIRDDVGTQ